MKGQLEIQFNWIFIIIIGAVILGFFFTLINSQAESSQQQISISQTRYFETIVTSTGQDSGVFKEYALADFTLDFYCDREQEVYSYSLSDIQARDTKYDILFTPDQLVGRDLLTWTLPYEIPYQAGIFQYATNSDHGFLFYNYSETLGSLTGDFETIYGDFIHNFTTYVISDTQSYDSTLNLQSYTYIFLRDEMPSDIDLVDTGRVLIIEPQRSDAFDWGYVYVMDAVTFEEMIGRYNPVDMLNPTDTERSVIDQTLGEYASDDAITRTGYVGKAALYGLFFVDTVEFYECTIDKAFTRGELLALMHYERVESFSGRVSTNCEQQLGIAEFPAIVRESDRFPRKRLLNYAEYFALGFDVSTLEDFSEHVRSIEQMNNDLQLSGNCPVIY